MKISDVIGGNMTPPAKVTSSIVSLIILGFLYVASWIPQIPETIISLGYAWLAFHIVNHLFVALYEMWDKKKNSSKNKK